MNKLSIQTLTSKSRFLTLILASFVLISINTACKKEKITDTTYSEFIGDWESVDATSEYSVLRISEGSGSWESFNGLISKTATGEPKISPNRDLLRLGFKKFKIDSYPIIIGGDWRMVLDGITFERF